MKTSGKVVLAFGLAALLVPPAMAQAPRPSVNYPGFFGGAFLSNKGLQKELKATEEQAAKLDALALKLSEKHLEKLRDIPREERREKLPGLSQSSYAEMDKGLSEILTPEQARRFEQIELQQVVLASFERPKVQEALKLTDAQKSRLRAISDEHIRARRDVLRGDRLEAMRKQEDLDKQANDKALAVLADDQKKTWKEMTGEPYEMKFDYRRPIN